VEPTTVVARIFQTAPVLPTALDAGLTWPDSILSEFRRCRRAALAGYHAGYDTRNATRRSIVRPCSTEETRTEAVRLDMSSQKGLVQRIERKLEVGVGDAFARVFGGSIVPREVEAMLRREAAEGIRPVAGDRLLASERIHHYPRYARLPESGRRPGPHFGRFR